MDRDPKPIEIYPDNLFSGKRELHQNLFRIRHTSATEIAGITQDAFAATVRGRFAEAGQSYQLTVVNPHLHEHSSGLMLFYCYPDLNQMCPDPRLITHGESAYSEASMSRTPRRRLVFQSYHEIEIFQRMQIANLVGTRRLSSNQFLINLLNPHPEVIWQAEPGINIVNSRELLDNLNLNLDELSED